MQNNRNFLIAMVLSVAVLVAWQFLVIGPHTAAQRQQQEAAQQTSGEAQNPGSLQTPTTPAGTPQADNAAPSGRESVVPGQTPANSPATPQTREAALAGGPRIRIDTPAVSGSINLRGARLDDLRLKKYHETVDDGSPAIVLLSPESTKDAYFAEFGYSGQDVGQLPGPGAVWQGDTSQVLTPDQPVTLTFTNPQGITFTRKIAIDANYMFTVTDSVSNGGSAPVSLSPYGRVIRFSKPAVAPSYVLFEGLLGVFGDAGLSEVKYSSIEKDGETHPDKAKTGWLGITDKYWATTVIPTGERAFKPTFRYADQGRPYYQSDYIEDPVEIAPGASADVTTRVFAGAKVVDLIDDYEHQLNIPRFGQLIDWGWFYFITRPMFHAIDWLYRLFGNFGLAILTVTVVLKLVFFPLASKSYKSMARMKAMQPKIMEMRERYKDDKVKQQQAMMEIYKQEKINPAAGCWPMLVQIPVFFALYKVLYVTIEMRHAPFFGWIQDLAAPDPTSLFNLFGLIPITLPHALMIGVWPLLMGVTMFVQMRLNPTPPDPTQQMIFTWMPVVFCYMMAAFPAGLVIYWTWNNTLSIIQQTVIMKRNGAKIELFDNLKGTFRRKPKEQGTS
ncbi:membrane protein insertase YidC [Mangrovibrevibacter kandeliae]|uniref:membrane protein insertase YidC n=1 Tax=Mangrovibrevibacter kandeliae TaxID=2968473 RepID=UPI002118AFBD|nr:membrane protein insertase YidC [Aurantimonas sp. CSK15Z-1]MCQ8783609.1 membrane protein insertase YidC [Aurantimonas sp. CSK15Z-1]